MQGFLDGFTRGIEIVGRYFALAFVACLLLYAIGVVVVYWWVNMRELKGRVSAKRHGRI
jgi:hypothetical protein